MVGDVCPLRVAISGHGHRHGIYKSPNLFVPNGIWIGQIILGHRRRQLDILKRQVEGHFFLAPGGVSKGHRSTGFVIGIVNDFGA